MLRGPDDGPRSPLRVALLTFGAVVLVGTMLTLVLLGKQGLMHDDPYGRGRLAGRGIGIAGVICAAIAYVVQQRRTRPPTT